MGKITGFMEYDRLEEGYAPVQARVKNFKEFVIGLKTEGLAMGLARDLAPVRVNAVCLGLILSEQVQGMGEGAIKGFTANLPLPRGGTVEEAAEAYLYLMRNTYVTGQVIRVDGGGSLV